jgi:general secretion pathway protein C
LPVQANTSTGQVRASAIAVSPRVTIDIAGIQSWYLFGRANAPASSGAAVTPAVDPNSASVTALDLALLGVLMSDDPEQSFAVIQSSSLSSLYKVGEPIPVGDGVVLAKVLVDRVIINNRGSMEALYLYDQNQKPLATNAVPAEKVVVDQRNNAEVSSIANGYRNQLLTNPMSMTDVIKVSIAKDPDGRVAGYRIRPGRDRAQFAKFGLQTGDVVTAINGVALDDPAKAMELYGQLKDAKEATFVVKRGNQEINLIVGLNQQ